MRRGRASDRWLSAQVAAGPLSGDLVQTWVAILFTRETGIHPRTPAAEAGIVVALFLRRSHIIGELGQHVGHRPSRALQSGDCGVGLATL